MNFRTIAYFFMETAGLKKLGTRFRSGDRPDQTEYEDLFNSQVWRTESDHRAKLDTGNATIDPSTNGHVVMATKQQIHDFTPQLTDRTLAVAPENLPDIVAGDASVAVAKLLDGNNIVYSITAASGGLLADATDTVSSNVLDEKLQVGTGLTLSVVEKAPGDNTLEISLVPPDDSPVFYIDSNNDSPEAAGGNGSILNPFVSLDRFIERLDGNLPELGPKVTKRVTAVVRGGQYAPAVQLWRGVNYDFQKGAEVTSANLGGYLFDNDALNITTDGGEILVKTLAGTPEALVNRFSYPNIYGEGDFDVEAFLNLSVQDWNVTPAEGITVETRLGVISFAYMRCTSNNFASISLGYSGYTGSSSNEHLLYNIIGNTNGRKARIRMEGNAPILDTVIDGALKSPQFTVDKVEFYDVKNAKTNYPIVLNQPTFGTTFTDCLCNSNISNTHAPAFIQLNAETRGLILKNFSFFHGNVSGFTAIEMNGSVSSSSAAYILLDNVTYTHTALLGTSNAFLKEANGGIFQAEFTTIVSYGAMYSETGFEYTDASSTTIANKLQFFSGGTATLKGSTYIGDYLPVTPVAF